MYTTNVNNDSSGITTDPSLSMNNNHNNNNNNPVGLDDLSQSLNDSDLYIPQMFAV